MYKNRLQFLSAWANAVLPAAMPSNVLWVCNLSVGQVSSTVRHARRSAKWWSTRMRMMNQKCMSNLQEPGVHVAANARLHQRGGCICWQYSHRVVVPLTQVLICTSCPCAIDHGSSNSQVLPMFTHEVSTSRHTKAAMHTFTVVSFRYTNVTALPSSAARQAARRLAASSEMSPQNSSQPSKTGTPLLRGQHTQLCYFCTIGASMLCALHKEASSVDSHLNVTYDT